MTAGVGTTARRENNGEAQRMTVRRWNDGGRRNEGEAME